MKAHKYIENRTNGVAIIETTGSAKHLIARFEKSEGGSYVRTFPECGFLNMTFDSVSEIAKYYGIRLKAYVYYVATEEETNGKYIEVPKYYEIEKETNHMGDTTKKQYPITASSDGDWLVSDKLLKDIAALKNTGYDVTIMY